MELNNFLLLALMLCVVTADIFIRMRLAPARRERSVEGLLNMLVPANQRPFADSRAGWDRPIASPVRADRE